MDNSYVITFIRSDSIQHILAKDSNITAVFSQALYKKKNITDSILRLDQEVSKIYKTVFIGGNLNGNLLEEYYFNRKKGIITT
ncbi:hypothetical protein NL526_27930, partial [Klebsiella pneumoniae]|nr:hypothetical protein [Klebsiella pneumoniae]